MIRKLLTVGLIFTLMFIGKSLAFSQEEQTFTGYLDQDNTSKTHTITLPNDGELKFNVVYDSTLDISAYNKGIIIYDTSETLLFYERSPSSGITYGPYGLKAATYYIKVLRYAGYGGYTFTTIYDAQAIDNDTEPNDQFSDANEAPLNASVTGHLGYKGGGDGTTDFVDIYTTTLNSDGELKFEITYDSTLDISLYNRGIEIYDASETLLFTERSPSSGVTYGPYGLKAATYYIKVLRDAGYGGYTFTTIYDAQAIDNDTEPNDQFSDANEAPLNASVTGHLGYKGGGDGTTDFVDIYTTTLNSDGELKFNITYDSTLDISTYTAGITIYDTNETLLFSEGSPSSGVTYGPCGLKAGTYYIKVLRYAGYGGYTLTTIYDAQTIANDTEPNDQFSNANEAPLNESVTGHLGYKGGGDGTTDYVDIFSATLGSDGELKFNITYDSTLDISTYTAGITIYDTNETLLFSEGSPSSGVTYGPYVLNTGTYYIKILRYSGYGGYTFTMFHPETGSLRATLTPQEAVEAGAKWRVDGGGWQDSGATVTGLNVGEHNVEYKAIAGWDAPSDETVTTVEGQTTQISREYMPHTGNLQITLTPQEAVEAGAKWRVDGGEWQDSGATITGLIVGEHDVEYNAIAEWEASSDETVIIVKDQTTQLTRTYKIIQTGNLKVTLGPEEAVNAGAQWNVDEGGWQDSGATVTGLVVGEHTVNYKIISGWTAPQSETVTINYNQTTQISRQYTPHTGSLKITLIPQEAVEAGAKWRVDGAEWQDSEATVSELIVGEQEVEYKAIAGWDAPSDETVIIVKDQAMQISREYTPHIGSLQVTLAPQEAVDAGAKWRVDEGEWQDSEATVTELNVTEHTVNYKSISGWIAPQSETVTINHNQTTQLTGTYTVRPNIYLSLDPSAGASGNNITLSVDISNNINQISSFGLDFVYDYTAFEFNEIGQGSLTSGWSIEGNEITPGEIKIGGYAGAGTIINENSMGSLVEIKLQVKCSDYEEETEIQLKIENYTDGITECFPHPCTTNFTLVPCPRLGDVNDDGELTPGDAQNAFEIYLGKITPDFCQDSTSDANCSGSITPGDAQEIFKHFLGKIILPDCCAESVGSSASPSLKGFTDKKQRKPDKRMLYPLNTICRSGEIIKVPIIIDDPEGIDSFGFEVNYDPELLEYLGLSESTLTNEFDYVREIKEVEGLVRVEGESKKPIKHKDNGSLAVMVFRVKEGINVGLPIVLFNLGKDLSRAETREGIFIGLDHFKSETRFLDLGEAIIKADGTLRIPVKVSSAFNLKSFGLELRYSKEKMIFTGVNRGALTRDFAALDGNEIEPGIIRVGGYSMSEIQESEPGVLVELVFYMRETGGDVEIVKLFDDIRGFIIQKGNIKLDKQNN